MAGTEVLTDCTECGGHGVVTICANDGRAGCSHRFDTEYPCRHCGGTGVEPVREDGLTDEQYEQLAALETAA